MNKKRPNICLLVAKITDQFSNDITRGAMKAALKADVNLTVIPGGYVGIQEHNDHFGMHYEYQNNVLFDYAAGGRFDLCIAAAGSIGYTYNASQLRDFLAPFKDMPIISLAADIEGCEPLLFDNSTGISQAVGYLAEQGRKHIGIMVGNLENTDCYQRYKAYRKSLDVHGLEFKESYVQLCDLSYECADEAAKLLDNNPELDAVICVTDPIAATLTDVITSRNTEVGKDIAVVGFDDLPAASEMHPKLASIRADAKLMGAMAVEKAVAMLNKNDAHEDIRLVPTEFIPRQSCYSEVNFVDTPDEMFNGSIEAIKDNLCRYATANVTDEQAKKKVCSAINHFIDLLDKEFIRSVAAPEARDRVIEAIEEMLSANTEANININLPGMHEIGFIWIVRNCRRENISMIREIYRMLRSRYNQARRKAAPAYDDMAHREKVFIQDSLMVGMDLKDSYSEILRRLCNINVKTSYLYILDKPIIHNYGFDFPTDLTWEFKAYSYGANTFSLPEKAQKMYTAEVFKNSFLVSDRPRIIVATPLYTAETQYGLVLLEPESPEMFRELDLITYQLSSAVRTLNILKELNILLTDASERNTELETESKMDEITRVYNRKGFYAACDEVFAKSENDCDFVVCYADTDNIKLVNHSYGHVAGDFMIKLTSDCLRHAFGKSAVIGRMGGGEFGVIIRKSQIFSIEDIMNRKNKFISDFNKSKIKPFTFCCSLGITEAECRDRSDLEAALEKSCERILEERGGTVE